MPENGEELVGLLFIGDPHLASRAPGFRKDDYPRTALAKVRWAIDYAIEHRLLPVLLGDLFDFPRDNANWMLVELLGLFARCPDGCALAVYGNHDRKENELGDNDTLSVLVTAGHVRLLDNSPWRGRINGCHVIVGGTSSGRNLPQSFDHSDLPPGELVRVFWITHHDMRFPGYEEEGRMDCRVIDGIDVVVNGHIHRTLDDVIDGGTIWLNPGNITRVKRGEATRKHEPAVLRIDISADGSWQRERVSVPHKPFDEVFHSETEGADVTLYDSLFVSGLAEMESVRTATGAGLRAFLDANLGQFEERVSREIDSLAKEVLNDAD